MGEDGDDGDVKVAFRRVGNAGSWRPFGEEDEDGRATGRRAAVARDGSGVVVERQGRSRRRGAAWRRTRARWRRRVAASGGRFVPPDPIWIGEEGEERLGEGASGGGVGD